MTKDAGCGGGAPCGSPGVRRGWQGHHRGRGLSTEPGYSPVASSDSAHGNNRKREIHREGGSAEGRAIRDHHFLSCTVHYSCTLVSLVLCTPSIPPSSHPAPMTGPSMCCLAYSCTVHSTAYGCTRYQRSSALTVYRYFAYRKHGHPPRLQLYKNQNAHTNDKSEGERLLPPGAWGWEGPHAQRQGAKDQARRQGRRTTRGRHRHRRHCRSTSTHPQADYNSTVDTIRKFLLYPLL